LNDRGIGLVEMNTFFFAGTINAKPCLIFKEFTRDRVLAAIRPNGGDDKAFVCNRRTEHGPKNFLEFSSPRHSLSSAASNWALLGAESMAFRVSVSSLLDKEAARTWGSWTVNAMSF
jgi:hypothetical protein